VVQVLTREGALIVQPEYVLRFQPPLTISNLLPFDITIVVTDRRVPSAHVARHRTCPPCSNPLVLFETCTGDGCQCRVSIRKITSARAAWQIHVVLAEPL